MPTTDKRRKPHTTAHPVLKSTQSRTSGLKTPHLFMQGLVFLPQVPSSSTLHHSLPERGAQCLGHRACVHTAWPANCKRGQPLPVALPVPNLSSRSNPLRVPTDVADSVARVSFLTLNFRKLYPFLSSTEDSKVMHSHHTSDSTTSCMLPLPLPSFLGVIPMNGYLFSMWTIYFCYYGSNHTTCRCGRLLTTLAHHFG
jgi:hypothetical protein